MNPETGGSNPPARTTLRSVDRLARYPAVYRDEASSILVRSAIFRRDAAVIAIVARPKFFCRVAELVQRSIVTREDVGSSPTPTAMPGNSAGRGDWSNIPAQLSSILSPGTRLRERSLAGKAPSF
jgi:hypothetical protein